MKNPIPTKTKPIMKSIEVTVEILVLSNLSLMKTKAPITIAKKKIINKLKIKKDLLFLIVIFLLVLSRQTNFLPI